MVHIHENKLNTIKVYKQKDFTVKIANTCYSTGISQFSIPYNFQNAKWII